ncbi:hypothetical protein Daura_14295 [Dactylosporangium aurantiacum]|uniref:Uncharacterized protein n=1 Tax=Dactylosporangium aurantiacum TaxID=35754 RepID=A0A9Q9INM7_9ACTN|nr:hypothetical protein [Dactylosporangium aurantiacum]MDG6108563.1 hypothetical protein [Dactylosporangium aurantiacum]UWZ57230.1 hypothetical protein Daura_14295 [Dactylosporangium aurantiacum]
MTAPQRAEFSLAGMGARVVALVGALGAVLAMSMPWASEDNTGVAESGEVLLLRGGVEWTGWGIYGASRLDGHRPVSLTVAMILIAGTVLVAIGAWVAFERTRRRWLPPATAAAAAVMLIVSFPGLEGVNGRFGTGHTTVTEFGIIVWRLAVAAVLLGSTRLALLQEAAPPLGPDAV